ncbi:hypothetical protein BAU15_14650 [Enterococcus sp. JM4C]|uniref:HdeD family acid-resistance protein n=1 Tax=Candidatus Enterococcus huntleyi TaxID=1857217 RepID=UPI001379F8D8|nr:DUF308 domain-containing protein [Enterococcus sp. JM4C]KAF1296579.1 hypothetical protein BAU15_14650 [Enterococcus sp. JM4C]
MEAFFQQFQKYAILRGIAYVLVGVFAFSNPGFFFKAIIYFIAGYFLLMGIINCLAALRLHKETGSYGFSMATSLFFILLALIVLFFSKAILSVIPFFLGLLIVVNGASQLLQALNATKAKGAWLFFSGLMIIAGLILMFNPFKTLLVVCQVFGILLIFNGLSELINYFQLKKLYK